MLGDEIDQKVQLYINQVSNRGGVISRSIAISVAKVLLERHESFGKIKITETWANSLLKRMGYVRRAKTSSTVNIPDGARKEIEYQYLYDIVSAVEKWNIPPDLVVNFDQTPSKLVPVGRSTLAKRNSTNVTIAGSSDKRTITATFAVSLSGNFLPPQLIYGGKTTQSLPKYEFPKSFSLSVNPTHYSNSQESIKFIKEILVPYFTKKRQDLGLSFDQKALIIFYVFTGQMTTEVREVIETHNLIVVNVPANMTKHYQVLDLTVNKYAKAFTRRKFNEWYAKEINRQLDAGTPLEQVDVKLRLSVMKPIHAHWMVELYNHMTTSDGKKNIISGWRAAGIQDAVKLGLNSLPSIDPFNDLDPMLDGSVSSGHNLDALCLISEDELASGYSRKENENDVDSEDEWEMSRGAFDAIQEIQDEFDEE